MSTCFGIYATIFLIIGVGPQTVPGVGVGVGVVVFRMQGVGFFWSDSVTLVVKPQFTQFGKVTIYIIW